MQIMEISGKDLRSRGKLWEPGNMSSNYRNYISNITYHGNMVDVKYIFKYDSLPESTMGTVATITLDTLSHVFASGFYIYIHTKTTHLRSGIVCPRINE